MLLSGLTDNVPYLTKATLDTKTAMRLDAFRRRNVPHGLERKHGALVRHPIRGQVTNLKGFIVFGISISWDTSRTRPDLINTCNFRAYMCRLDYHINLFQKEII